MFCDFSQVFYFAQINLKKIAAVITLLPPQALMIKSIASEVRGGRYLCVVGAGVSVGCEGPLLSKSASVASTTVASRTMSSTEKHTGLQTKCVSMAEIPSLCLLFFIYLSAPFTF